MEPVLRVSGLTIDVPMGSEALHAVRDVSFEVRRGETLCLVGESGSGKSLTAKGLLGLLPSFMKVRAEEVSVAGHNLNAMSARDVRKLRGDRAAMIFQEPMTSLHPTKTIRHQLVEAYVQHNPGRRREAEDRAIALMESVGITAPHERLRQYPHELSGGMQQRIMIAMALMCSPDILLADEPTTALDVTIQAQILELLQGMQKTLGIGILFITHDLGVVARIADRVAVMYCGQIVEMGDTRTVFENPKHPYTLGLLNSIPSPGRTKRGEPLPSIPGVVPSLIGDIGGCAFRFRCSSAVADCIKNPPIHHDVPMRFARCWQPNAHPHAR